MRLTATGESTSNEDAQVFVHDLDLFATVQLLDETPTILLLHMLCSKRQFYRLVSFAQNVNIHLSGKTAKLHDWPKTGSERDEQGGSNARHSWLVKALHRQSRGPGDACVSHIPLKERTQIWKVRLKKWRHKNESIVFMLTSAKPKEIHSGIRKVLVT